MATAMVEAVTAPSSDAARLRSVVERHYDFLWRSLRRMGIAEASVEDGAQQVLLVVSRRLGQIPEKAERAFLFATALRVAADYRKKQNRSPEVIDDDVISRQPADCDLERAIDDHRARELLDRVLGELPEELRTVFILADLEEMTMASIAEVLGVPSGTVASRLRRARVEFQAKAARLRRQLVAEEKR